MPAKMPSPMGACTATRTRSPRSEMMAKVRDRTSSSRVPMRYVSISTSSSGGLIVTASVLGAPGAPSASRTPAMHASLMCLRASFDAGMLLSQRLSGRRPASPRPPGNAASRSRAAAPGSSKPHATCMSRRCASAPPAQAAAASSSGSKSAHVAFARSSPVSKLRPKPPTRRRTTQVMSRPSASQRSSVTPSSTADPPVRWLLRLMSLPKAVLSLTMAMSRSSARCVTWSSTAPRSSGAARAGATCDAGPRKARAVARRQIMAPLRARGKPGQQNAYMLSGLDRGNVGQTYTSTEVARSRVHSILKKSS